ncbi:hypothetical protein J3F83DRAFT_390621 [Trichoderma novae-zelandiae]
MVVPSLLQLRPTACPPTRFASARAIDQVIRRLIEILATTISSPFQLLVPSPTDWTHSAIDTTVAEREAADGQIYRVQLPSILPLPLLRLSCIVSRLPAIDNTTAPTNRRRQDTPIRSQFALQIVGVACICSLHLCDSALAIDLTHPHSSPNGDPAGIWPGASPPYAHNLQGCCYHFIDSSTGNTLANRGPTRQKRGVSLPARRQSAPKSRRIPTPQRRPWSGLFSLCSPPPLSLASPPRRTTRKKYKRFFFPSNSFVPSSSFSSLSRGRIESPSAFLAF